MLELNVKLALVYLKYMMLLPLILFVASTISNILQQLGVYQKLEPILRPLVKALKIPPYLLPAVVSSLIDSRVEHSIVYDALARGLITPRFVIYYNLTLSFIRYVNVVLIHILPMSILTLGLAAGLLYSFMVYVKGVLTTALGLLYGGLFIRAGRDYKLESVESRQVIEKKYQERNVKLIVKISVQRAIALLKRTIGRMLIVMTIMTLLSLFDVYSLLNEYVNSTLGSVLSLIIPKSELVTLVVVASLQPTAALFMAAPMLEQSILTVKEVVVGLLLGGMFFVVLFDLTKHSFPFYASIYPVNVAFKLSISLIVATLVTTPLTILLVLAIPI